MAFLDGWKRVFGVEPGGGDAEADAEMISCEDALRLIHEFLDGELDHVSRDKVKAHFDACGRCYPHLCLEESFREAVQTAARGEHAPPELKSRLMDLLAEAAAEE